MNHVRAIALAFPLVLGSACAHRGEQTGAVGTSERGGGTSREAQAAEEPMFRPGPAVKGHASDEVISGRIASAQGGSVSILTEQGKTETLQIAPETSVQVDGQDSSSTALQEGLPVRASFNEVQGEKIAVEVWAGNQPASSMSGTGSSAEPALPSPGSTGSAPSAPEPALPPPTPSPGAAEPTPMPGSPGGPGTSAEPTPMPGSGSPGGPGGSTEPAPTR